jgi:hypothetical protein
MKEEKKHPEKKLGNHKHIDEDTTVRKNIDPLEKKEIRNDDKKRMEGDVVESHLGIDE